MNQPVRVLQVLGGTTLCGAESRIMDLYRNMDKNKVQFDFVVHNQNEDYFNPEIRSLGGNIYRIPRFKFYNFIAYRKAWREFFKEHQEFQAVHGHMTSTAAIYLPIAKKAGVPITIAHARSAGTDPGLKGKLTRFLRRNLSKKTDYCFACSKLAGKAVFGESALHNGKVQIIPNAIEVEKYLYNKQVRKEIREQYKLTNDFVIGHVGRFHYAKNHEFLREIFAEVVKRQSDARLLLVGEGELMEPTREKARQLGVLDKVVFAGSQGNVSAYFQAMDYMVFPSHFEGLPGTIVEAQAAGLRCLISDAITDEVMVTELVKARSIQDKASDWAEQILEEKDYVRSKDLTELQAHGFDVVQQVKDYEDFYVGKKSYVVRDR